MQDLSMSQHYGRHRMLVWRAFSDNVSNGYVLLYILCTYLFIFFYRDYTIVCEFN